MMMNQFRLFRKSFAYEDILTTEFTEVSQRETKGS